MNDGRPSASSRLPHVPPLHYVLALGAAALVLASIGQTAPTPAELVDGVPRLGSLLERMWPPNLDPGFVERLIAKLVETFQIALAGTAIGVALALPLGWLAARGLTPLPWATFAFKALIAFFRTVPDLVWALIFVATVGLGAVAGTLTIVVDTIGFCGRFFADAMEDAEPEPQRALEALGAPRGTILLGAVVPSALPSMIDTALFALEKAVRSSVVLGLVGAGGIGQELKASFDLFQYRNAATILLAVFVVVLAMEWATARLRRRAA